MSHNKAKKKQLAVHNGIPPKQPVLNEAHKLIKAESVQCPDHIVVLNQFKAGYYDPDYLFKFSGFVGDSKFLFAGTQRLTLQDPEKKTVVGIIRTRHSFHQNTYVTIYGWLGLTSTYELSLIVQLLEFDFPSENEPNFIDPRYTFPPTPFILFYSVKISMHCLLCSIVDPPSATSKKPDPPAVLRSSGADQVLAGPATPEDTCQESVTKPSAEERKENGSPDLTLRSVDPPATTSQPRGGTVVSGLICDTSDAAIKGTGKLDEGKGMEPDASVGHLRSLERCDLADYIKDMEITKRINLTHYELLAAEILNRVVRQDISEGESYLFRTLPEPLRSSVSTIVSSCGYDFASFSTLADEITNTRHECAYLFSPKSFEDNVHAAKLDFCVYYRVQMKHGGFGKSKEYFQCLNDVFNMYHLLKKVFKEY